MDISTAGEPDRGGWLAAVTQSETGGKKKEVNIRLIKKTFRKCVCAGLRACVFVLSGPPD